MSKAEPYEYTPSPLGGIPSPGESPAEQVAYVRAHIDRSREGADLCEAVELADIDPQIAFESLLAVRTCTMPALHALVLKHIEERIALDRTIMAGGLH